MTVRDLTGLDVSSEPGAVRVRKRPLPVTVEFASAPGALLTLEGPVQYVAGDALLTGSAGERWPVRLERFDQTYEPLPPTRAGDNGAYRKKPVTVWGMQLNQPACVRVGYASDPISGGAGDWLLQYGPADYGIVSAAVFAASYEVLDSPGRADKRT